MNDLRYNNYDNVSTPPGTPPPPYPSPLPKRRQTYSNRNSSNTDEGDSVYDEVRVYEAELIENCNNAIN